ncbi:MAG: lactate utilization protein [Gemmatimonadota bacterium]|nr:MAG: lactate utilization protein [Gemmatimonadota bacterium]
MIYDSIEARDEIFARLRRACSGSRSVFREALAHLKPPDPPTPVTHADGDRRSLAARFGAKLEAASGSYEILEDAAEASQRVVQLAREWGAAERATESAAETIEILSWASRALPIENLGELLKQAGTSLIVPDDMHDERTRARAARVNLGLTGADAAFASTGSIVLASGRGKSRAASLLPARHLVLVPMSRIHTTFEAWLRSLRAKQALGSFLRVSGQVVFITGPSKSADIELYLTLGVHGPKSVHALIFDDIW